FQPVAHRRLITIVDLNVFEAGRILRDEVEVIEHLLRCDTRTEAIPGAPSRRWSLAAQWWMILNKASRQLREQLVAVRSGRECEFLQFPCLTRREFEIFCVDHSLQRLAAQIELAAETAARSEGHQLCRTLRRRKRDQTIERTSLRRRRHLVVLRIR